MTAPRATLFSLLCMASTTAFGETLVVDYSTFVGAVSSNADSVNAVAADGDGNVYIGGSTGFDSDNPLDTGIPTTPASLHLPNPRSADNPCKVFCGYILKLDRNHDVVYGAILPWMDVRALAVDAAGAVYATGVYEPGADVVQATPGAFSTMGSTFALKLDPSGSRLEYSAAFKGNEARAIAVDELGNAFIIGDVAGNELTTTPLAVKPAKDTMSWDAYLLKIDPTGTALVFGTYLGGSKDDSGYGVVLDGAGGAVVVGKSKSDDFVGFPGAISGTGDAFVMHIAADGSGILAARYIGGTGDEYAAAISPDGQGGYLLAGSTTSADFPVTTGVIEPRMLGEVNGWLARLEPDLSTRYATYVEGSFQDGLLAVTADADGGAYVVGTTFSADMPTSPDGFQDASAAFTGSDDYDVGLGTDFYPQSDAVREAYLASISPDGTAVRFATYFGGYYATPRQNAPLTLGAAIARAPDGAIAVAGMTTAESFPITADGLRAGMGGRLDGFLVHLVRQDLAVGSPTLLPAAHVSEVYEYRLDATGGVPPYQWDVVGFRLPEGLELTPAGRISGTVTSPTETDGYQFTARVLDAAGHAAHKSLFINIEWPPLGLGLETVTCAPTLCSGEFASLQPIDVPLPYPARGVPPFILFDAGKLPPGMEVNARTWSFGGTPTIAGVYDFSFVIEDALGARRSVKWHLKITGGSILPPSPPVPAPPPTVPTPVAPQSGGGGGALNGLELSFLLLGLLLRRQQGARLRVADEPASGRRPGDVDPTVDSSADPNVMPRSLAGAMRPHRMLAHLEAGAP